MSSDLQSCIYYAPIQSAFHIKNDVFFFKKRKDIKAFKLLEGARGTKPADIAKVEETLMRISQLVTDFADIVELDINPLMISEATGEAIAVDGRIRLK